MPLLAAARGAAGLFAYVSGAHKEQQQGQQQQGQQQQQQQQSHSLSSNKPAAPVPSHTASYTLQDLQQLVDASGLDISAQQLKEWLAGCRVWASQIEKDVHRTFPGHNW